MGGGREGVLQQHPGTLEGCSQERRGDPGPLPGDAAWGKDRPPPLQTSCNSASRKAQGSPIRATGLHLLVQEGCQRHRHNFQNPWEPCPAPRSHSGPSGSCLGSTPVGAGVPGAPGEPGAPDGGGACALSEVCEQRSRASERCQDTFRGGIR